MYTMFRRVDVVNLIRFYISNTVSGPNQYIFYYSVIIIKNVWRHRGDQTKKIIMEAKLKYRNCNITLRSL